MELQPWAMLANGPPWMKAGVPSSVCYFGQGYLYSKPIPAQEFDEKYMKERKR